jgi:hypothetical protein
MKVSITGASNFVNRMFEACGNYQWARELLKNSLEAGATKIEFGIEWQAVETLGVYRRTIIDNGCGMEPNELLSFFSTLGLGNKVIGGVHDNFGVGAKIAALPWNPDGMVVISYKGGTASMIKIVLDPETNEYELVEYDLGDKRTCVIDPTTIEWSEDVNWGAIAPAWATEHGTVVVLLGSDDYPDTVLGNAKAEERDIKGLSVYLNTRFWDLSHVEVRVTELRSEKKNSWPTQRDDRDDARRPNNRQIMGARHFVEYPDAKSGKLSSKSTVLLDEERVMADWYLWEGERPAIHSYAKKGGFVAVRYKDELFELSSAKPVFRAFGVIESQVQQNLTIILEPQLYDPTVTPWGVHPDQSRNRLIFTGNGEKGGAVPMTDWGAEFAANMPDEILKAILKARGEHNGTIDDEEYRKRLQDRFGDRWRIKRQVAVAKKTPEAPEGTPGTDQISVVDTERDEDRSGVVRTRKRKKTIERVHVVGTAGTGAELVEKEVQVDVPKYRYSTKEDFENELHIAQWSPRDPEGPTVILNVESPVIVEAIKYHQEQYPDIYAEEIMHTVKNVYGEVAAAKIAHSQKLATRIPEQQLDADYRSEKALTVALMGLMAEDTVISQRLGRFGRKKAATKAEETVMEPAHS